jgi:hypothetical protein
MKKILIAFLFINLCSACEIKPQHIQDQTEAINDTAEKISEELADESISESPKDSLSAKK